jgi:SAM-dependent methyltransferase
MGFTLPGAKIFMELGVSHPFSGRVLQLGRQDISFAQDVLEKAADQVGFQLLPADPEPLVQNTFLPDSPFVISDTYFFKRMGFNEVDSLDVSNFENPSIIFDLNLSRIPDKYNNAFDVVIDGGTIEHVFHLPNVLKNISDFLRPGGIAVHTSPVHNFYEHGFYMFNPTFFHDFYAVNNFEIVTSQLIRFDPNRNRSQFQRIFLLPRQRALQDLARVGSLDGRCYAIFFAARKTSESQGTIIPQQSAYLEKWPDVRGGNAGAQETGGKSRHNNGDKNRSIARKIIKKVAKSNRFTHSLYKTAINKLEAPQIKWENI